VAVLGGVIVPSVLAAETASTSAAGSVSYMAVFTGKGTFTSTQVTALDLQGRCSNATDKIVENSKFTWNVSYTISVPKNAYLGMTVSADGVYGETQLSNLTGSTWKSTSTITPGGCLGTAQNCSGSLDPAGPDHPAQAGDTRVPKFTGVVDSDQLVVNAQSVVDWVVSQPVTGSSDCSTLFGRYARALEPFALGAQDPAAGLSVAGALAAGGAVPRATLDAGNPYTMKALHPESQPPSNCKSLAADDVSCSEKLNWSGKVTFTALKTH